MSITETGEFVGKIKRTASDHLKYWVLDFNGSLVGVHRLVWQVYRNETIDNFIVNHIDCNGLNNKIENLELCSTAQNNRRQSQHIGLKLRKDNTSGILGVRVITTKGYTYSVCRIRYNGKLYEKAFSHLKHGEKLATELAIKYREELIQRFNLNGAGFSINTQKGN